MTAQIRPMTDETVGSCDWGGCDRETVAERRDPRSGEWLGVCRPHSSGRADRQQSMRRAHCPDCCGEYALTVGGAMRLHSRGFARCPGSGRLVPAGVS